MRDTDRIKVRVLKTFGWKSPHERIEFEHRFQKLSKVRILLGQFLLELGNLLLVNLDNLLLVNLLIPSIMESISFLFSKQRPNSASYDLVLGQKRIG